MFITVCVAMVTIYIKVTGQFSYVGCSVGVWFLMCVCVVVFAGEFGTVYKGTWKDGSKQTPIAVKTLRVG